MRRVMRARRTDDLTMSHSEVRAVARIDATTRSPAVQKLGQGATTQRQVWIMAGRPKREDHPIERLLPKQHHDKAVPFGVGNTIGVIHGLYSQRVRSPIEERMADAIRGAMQESLGTAYNASLDEHAIRRAARALATIEMTEALLDEHGVDAVSDRTAHFYRAASNQAAKWLTELGMTPAARAKLGVDVARQFDLVSALQARRQERERLCDYCRDEPAWYRLRRLRRVICEDCASAGAHLKGTP